MAEAFNTDLLGDLARQRVVLFLGAGVSASAVTASGGRIAGWPAFLHQTAAQLVEPLKAQVQKLIDDKDYLLACELMQTNLGDRWETIVADEYGQIAKPSELHKALIRLDQRIVITTNFDKVLEDAWSRDDEGGTHYARVIPRIDDRIFKTLKDHDSRYLLKIHGTVDDPDTLIFSRSEYIRLAFGNQNYSGFLESLLLNYTFLYVGFSMDDPAITSLMEMYALRYPSSRPHYIFAPAEVPENIVEVHKRLRRLVVLQYDAADHHAALPPLIMELGRAARNKQRELMAASLARIPEESAFA